MTLINYWKLLTTVISENDVPRVFFASKIAEKILIQKIVKNPWGDKARPYTTTTAAKPPNLLHNHRSLQVHQSRHETVSFASTREWLGPRWRCWSIRCFVDEHHAMGEEPWGAWTNRPPDGAARSSMDLDLSNDRRSSRDDQRHIIVVAWRDQWVARNLLWPAYINSDITQQPLPPRLNQALTQSHCRTWWRCSCGVITWPRT
jgi:hypothetical protein